MRLYELAKRAHFWSLAEEVAEQKHPEILDLVRDLRRSAYREFVKEILKEYRRKEEPK